MKIAPVGLIYAGSGEKKQFEGRAALAANAPAMALVLELLAKRHAQLRFSAAVDFVEIAFRGMRYPWPTDGDFNLLVRSMGLEKIREELEIQ